MKKRLLTILICFAVCFGMYGAVFVIPGENSPVHAGTAAEGTARTASAAEDTSQTVPAAEGIDFAEFQMTGGLDTGSDSEKNKGFSDCVSTGSSSSSARDTITISRPSGADRVNFVSTSTKTFDFSRSFSFRGAARISEDPDGMAVVFQPDRDYAYEAGAGQYGSSLCVYRIENAARGVRNALVLEFDTYLTGDNGTDGQTAVRDAGQPHMALTTVGEDGKENDGGEHPVRAVPVSSGAVSFSMDWEITDADSGTGCCTVRYGSGDGERTMRYENFDPKAVFGTFSVYMTVAGSVNYGYDQPDGDWQLRLFDFAYRNPPADPPELSVKESSSQSSRYAEDNKIYRYTITVENKGTSDAVGVFIRRYMPEYTNFYSTDSPGHYGCVDGREHVSWFIGRLKAGECVQLTFRAAVNNCRPDKLVIRHRVYYQILGSETPPMMNTGTDPEKVAADL